MGWRIRSGLMVAAAGLVAVVAAFAGGGWGIAGSGPAVAGTADNTITVYKSPTCGCCTAWVDAMRAADFRVEARDVDQRELNDIKREAGLQRELASCHTAFVDGYVIEGHVPAEDIRRLLAQRPEVDGLAVPGMPVGSPGMEMGDRRDPFEVVTFVDGRATGTFARHNQ